MKIAVFTAAFPTRVSTFLARDLFTLIQAGHDVDVFTMRPLEKDLFRLIPDYLDRKVLPRKNYHHYTCLQTFFSFLKLHPKAYIQIILQTVKILLNTPCRRFDLISKNIYASILGAVYSKKADQFDLVLSYWGNYSATSAILFNKLSYKESPFVMILHAGTDLYRDRILMESKLHYADLLFTVCNYNKHFIKIHYPKLYPKIQHKIKIHILGLDLEQFKVTDTKRANNVVIGVGGFRKAKGFHYLVRAIGELKRRGRLVNLQLIGDGDEYSNLKRIAAEEGVVDQVVFFGWQKNTFVQDAMQKATMLVHPSGIPGDAMPTVLKEAMALGTPVIGSAITCIPELLGNNRYGLVFPPRNVKAMADRIERVLVDQDLRQHLSRMGRKRIEEFADNKTNGRLFLEQIEKLVDG